jgi:hypothetical protein
MKISEYRILEQAFENSFGFMLNRILDLGLLKGDPHGDKALRDRAEEQAFNEFVIALEEMGVELGEAEVSQG